tara:strand:+ start:6773 stop:7597 length:825 start_codon:yes stop_codon:yes gene_type:complete
MLKGFAITGVFLILILQSVCGQDSYVEFPENNSFLPRSWIADPIGAKIDPLKPDYREAAQKIILKALAKYPDEILEQFLDQVSLVGSLSFYDVGYGGTYMANGRQVVLVYRPTFDPRGFEQRFHHEFSSILLKKNEALFDGDRWHASNKDTFSYRAPGIVEEQSGDRSEATRVLAAEQKKTGGSGSTLLKLDLSLMEQGFLTSYNRVSVEQDLNETVAHLFTNPDLWNYCERFPRIDQKVDIIIDFYRSLDVRMNRLYFRRITAEPSATPEPAP